MTITASREHVCVSKLTALALAANLANKPLVVKLVQTQQQSLMSAFYTITDMVGASPGTQQERFHILWQKT